MSEPQPPTGRSASRHSRQGPDDALATLARAAGSGLPEGGGQQALRAAGVPLVAAALVAGAAGTASAAGSAPAVSAGRHASPASASPGKPSSGKARTKARAPVGQPTPAVTYTVQPGDSVATIAARTKLDPASIIAANHLPASGLIHPGQVLVLPGLNPVKGKSTLTPKASVVAYPVKAGDTVTDVARRYKISVASIITANRLGPDGVIRPGQKLVLPGVRPRPVTPRAAAPTHAYPVKAGDTLVGISRTAKADLADVLALNHLTRGSVIHPGQRLLLPGPDPNAVPNTFLGRTYPDAVAQAAAANRATLASRKVPTRAQMQAIVVDVARSMGIDPALAQAIAYQESGFNQRVVSPANAIGCMQVIPRTGVWASQLVGRPLDLLVPLDNVTAGVAVLAALLAQAPEPDAIAGYYQGLASVQAHGRYDDTRRYVASVLTLETRFAAADPGAAPPAPDPAAAAKATSTGHKRKAAPQKAPRQAPADAKPRKATH